MPSKKYRSSKISSEAIFATPSMPFSKLVLGIVLSLGILVIDVNTSLSLNIRGYAQDLIKPFYYLSQFPKNLYNIVNFTITTRQELNIEINDLEREKLLLELKNSSLVYIQKENQELKFLINSTLDPLNYFSFATKMRMSNNSLQPVLTISFDPKNKVLPNQAVFSSEGLVGKIFSVGLQSAEVRLIQDLNSFIPIFSLDSGLHGIIQGQGLDRKGLIINTKKTSFFKKGEFIVTSGLGGEVPPGYPVGYIESISNQPGSKFLRIEVTFLSNIIDTDMFLVFDSKKVMKEPESE